MGRRIFPTGFSVVVLLDDRRRGLLIVGDVVIVTSWVACGIESIEQFVILVIGRNEFETVSFGVLLGRTIWTFFAKLRWPVVDGVNLTNLMGFELIKQVAGEVERTEVCCCCCCCCCICCFWFVGETRIIFVFPIWILVVGFGTTVWKLSKRGATNTVDVDDGLFIESEGNVDWCLTGDEFCCIEFLMSLAVDERSAKSFRKYSAVVDGDVLLEILFVDVFCWWF